MQIQDSSKIYKSMVDCARFVYRNEGIGAFYVSYPTTLSMTVPFTALQFLAYESILTSMNPGRKYDPLTHCIAGAVAGGFAAGLTTPMDVIKTILQTRGTSSDPQIRNVNGFLGGCQLLYYREGLRGFFKGVRPRIVTTMPSTAICWSAYEFSKYEFNSHRSKPMQLSLIPTNGCAGHILLDVTICRKIATLTNLRQKCWMLDVEYYLQKCWSFMVTVDESVGR